MQSVQVFTIDKVEWHTRVEGNTESVESIHDRFRHLIAFLQENELVTCPILKTGEAITNELAIRSDQLTDDGLQLMKKSYDKWLKQIDEGGSPADVSLLVKTLSKLRKE